MPQLSVWEWVLCAGAAFLGVMMLVRLMLGRRENVLNDLSWQAELQQRRDRRAPETRDSQ